MPARRYARLTSVISSSPRAEGSRPRCDLDDPLVEEVNASHSIVRRRAGGLLLETHDLAVRVEPDHTIALRIAHIVAKDRRTLRAPRCALQHDRKVLPIEDVVAEYQRCRATAEEVGSDQESLRDALRLRLCRILDRESPLRTVAEQVTEGALVARGRDNQVFADTGEHQRRQRVVDHRLVVDRQQLLAYNGRDRVETGAGAARQDDPLANLRLSLRLLHDASLTILGPRVIMH